MPIDNLSDLASAIAVEHQLVELHANSAVQHALRCGELLLQAKAQLQHGEWLGWLRDNCHVGTREAQRYMRLAREVPKLPTRRCDTRVVFAARCAR